MSFLTAPQCRALADQVLRLSRADDTVVELRGETGHHLRFARNAPTTGGAVQSIELTVHCSFGRRTGSMRVNQLDPASIAAAVRRAEELAGYAPEDPEYVAPLAAQRYLALSAFDEETARDGESAIVRGVARCVDEARRRGLGAAGFARSVALSESIASSRGLFAHHGRTEAYAAVTARTAAGDGSGWASQASTRAAGIDHGALARTACAKAEAARAPRELAPGDYVTILEPSCVANLLDLLGRALDARAADEGRSFFAGGAAGETRVGETLISPQISITSDPSDPRAPGRPWGLDGVPQQPRTWFAQGTLRALSCERYWAQRTAREPVPPPSNLIVQGGSGTTEELVASTERGLLITSLWYIRSLDPRTLLYTGLTRDGVFWIENGRIAYPVRNFRWNDSPISVLKNVLAMSAPVSVPPRPQSTVGMLVPALKLRRFGLSSISDAI